MANLSAGAGTGLNLHGDFAGKGVSIGTSAIIYGDVQSRQNSISLSNNSAIYGNVLGNGNIWLGNNSTVQGDARPGIGKNLSRGNNVVITGSTQPGSFTFDTFTLPALNEFEQRAFGTVNISAARGSTTNLLPGSYRNWSIDKDSTLNLAAGDYVLREFWINKNSRVSVNTSAGDVTLYVNGDFSTGSDVAFEISGTGRLFINVFDHDVWLDDNVSLSAAVNVFGGDFGTDSGARLTGSFFATDDVWLGSNSQLVFQPFITPIPEPGSIAVFAATGLMIWLFKKDKKRISDTDFTD
jgi:hypothetical protein